MVDSPSSKVHSAVSFWGIVFIGGPDVNDRSITMCYIRESSTLSGTPILSNQSIPGIVLDDFIADSGTRGSGSCDIVAARQ